MKTSLRSLAIIGVLAVGGLGLGASPARAQVFGLGINTPRLSVGVGSYGGYGPYYGGYGYGYPGPVVVAPAPVIVPPPVVLPRPYPYAYRGYGPYYGPYRGGYAGRPPYRYYHR